MLDGPVHPLLGYRLRFRLEPIWQSEIDANSPRYLQDHRIDARYRSRRPLCRADARGRMLVSCRGRGDFLSRGIVSQRRNVDADRNLARPKPAELSGVRSRQRRAGTDWVLARTPAALTLAGSRISECIVDAEDRAAAASGPRAFLPGFGQGMAHLRPGIPGRRNDLVCGGLRARQISCGAGIDHRCGQIHPSPRLARRLPAGTYRGLRPFGDDAPPGGRHHPLIDCGCFARRPTRSLRAPTSSRTARPRSSRIF